MKLNQLRQLIKEELEAIQEKEFSTKSYEIDDEVGKFFVATKPKSKKATIDDIVFESDVFHFANQIKGGLAFDDVIGIYEQKSDARRKGTESLKEYDMQLKEMEDAMNEFREAKKVLMIRKSSQRKNQKSSIIFKVKLGKPSFLFYIIWKIYSFNFL